MLGLLGLVEAVHFEVFSSRFKGQNRRFVTVFLEPKIVLYIVLVDKVGSARLGGGAVLPKVTSWRAIRGI